MNSLEITFEIIIKRDGKSLKAENVRVDAKEYDPTIETSNNPIFGEKDSCIFFLIRKQLVNQTVTEERICSIKSNKQRDQYISEIQQIVDSLPASPSAEELIRHVDNKVSEWTWNLLTETEKSIDLRLSEKHYLISNKDSKAKKQGTQTSVDPNEHESVNPNEHKSEPNEVNQSESTNTHSPTLSPR